MVSKKVLSYQNDLKSRIQHCKDMLKGMPSGNILLCKNGNYIKWYKSNGHKPTYIPKGKRALAEKLALKKYYKQLLKETSYQLSSLEKYIKDLNNQKILSESFLSNSSPLWPLLKSHFNSFPENVTAWLSEAAPPNPNHRENCIHQTLKGDFVRSKSEVIIANALYLNHIPYKYECPIDINGATYYPDFTIYSLKENKIYYWEHFGLMDNITYQTRCADKLKMYFSNNIIPSINLITTFENSETPISSSNIQALIDHYFL